ncbi:hypothetical protein ACIQBJ_06975 [Kitasatospora sp. NPDC088391]|uniref:LppU/SCO3897 family protein n=1 Tax=Kitasatospora sp. NPDC088391 TaxID=3364074 RepID=UPI00381D2820
MSVPAPQLPSDPTSAPAADPIRPLAEQASQGRPGAYPPPGQEGPQCRVCGSVPAVAATVRAHVGLVVVMRFRKVRGPFCRSCGLATLRELSADSLWQGWTSIGSVLWNPITLLANLLTWFKLRRLADPVPGAPGVPEHPGRPLYHRPELAGLLIPVAAAGLFYLALKDDPDLADVGDCVHATGTFMPDVKVVDCADRTANYRIIGRFEREDTTACHTLPGSTASYVASAGHSRYTLCLSAIPNPYGVPVRGV